MNSVAVIGGGITGLTAAFYLKRQGVPVTLYEASDRVGGAIRTVRKDGYLAEFGPNTILETSPRIGELVRDTGLESRRLDPDPSAEARYVVRYKRPIEMPAKPLGFLTTPLFALGAKWAVLREPFLPAKRDGAEESIADFVRRRLCGEFLDHAIDALVGGIYAGNPEKLSVQQAFPKLAALEEKYGSLIKGQILGARERKQRGEVAKDRAPKFSFDEGLQVLPDELCRQLGEAVRLNTPVTRIAEVDEGWRLTVLQAGTERAVDHSAVVYAGTTYAMERIEFEFRQAPSIQALTEIRYPPVASVVLGFRREDVTHPCSGFGMLIPGIEGYRILGTIFSSALFPNRAPAGHLTLTSYLGGERNPELAGRSAEELYATTCEDLKVLLGVKGEPTFRHHFYWPRAIPQYNVGYGKYRELMNEIESNAPRLHFAGHYRDGISLADSILSGMNIVPRVLETLNS